MRMYSVSTQHQTRVLTTVVVSRVDLALFLSMLLPPSLPLSFASPNFFYSSPVPGFSDGCSADFGPCLPQISFTTTKKSTSGLQNPGSAHRKQLTDPILLG